MSGMCFGSDLPVSGSWSGSAGDGCRLREREAGGGREGEEKLLERKWMIIYITCRCTCSIYLDLERKS